MTTPVILTFPDYPPARFTTLQAVLAQKGLTTSGTDGEIKKDHADVVYDEENNVLTLTVKSAPILHTMEGFVLSLSKIVNGIPQ